MCLKVEEWMFILIFGSFFYCFIIFQDVSYSQLLVPSHGRYLHRTQSERGLINTDHSLTLMPGIQILHVKTYKCFKLTSTHVKQWLKVCYDTLFHEAFTFTDT